MSEETILITGAGTGFGKDIAFRLAEMGKKVIASVEAMSQVSALEKEAREKGVSMRIEKLDITNEKDRKKAWEWDVDVLVNNAAIKEGGSLVDIPEENLRRQFDVNAISQILLTQKFARKMIQKKQGRIVFTSSVSGLMVNPFSGPYAGSKYALEAFADTLSRELQEFNIEVATINPGPYLTGFNDREFETWKDWPEDPERVFNMEEISFPFEQYDPKEVVEPAIKVILGETKQYRNVVPESMIQQVKEQAESLWTKQTDEGLGQRNEMVQKAYDIDPATKAEDY
ncbi:SDR family oxidoreductase [Desemzia incerta]|uniref:SDR family oxidoreductase n=1 Tax=Desemzia incerta TaxID=82801 RepID=UPI003314DF77